MGSRDVRKEISRLYSPKLPILAPFEPFTLAKAVIFFSVTISEPSHTSDESVVSEDQIVVPPGARLAF